MEKKEFYVIVNERTLMFCSDCDDYTMEVSKAMQFENFFDCKDELESFDDDVRDNFAIYKVTQILETYFEKMYFDKM